MPDRDLLAAEFETHRPRLRAVAYRMLGSVAEAEDAVQDAWLRLNAVDRTTIDNLGGWLTTVVARVSLDALRTRKARREDAFGIHIPEPIISQADVRGPDEEVLLADSVGLALLVVLETLTPAERLSFVLHDTFGLSFDEIGRIVGRSPVAARQLASRARRRIRATPTRSDVDLRRQQEVVDAFVAAARDGDFAALLAVLDPDVVIRADAGAVRNGAIASREVRGAPAVATTALGFRRLAGAGRPVIVNGGAGIVVFAGSAVYAVLGFTIRGARIAAIDILADPERLARLDLGRLA